MNQTEATFLNILANYINNAQDVKFDKDIISSKEFKELVRNHRVPAIVHNTINGRPDIDEATKHFFQIGFFSALSAYAKRQIVLGKIEQIFNGRQIPYICIKGSHIAELYPNPEFRNMSDIDIVIKKDDRANSHDMMIKSGFEYDEEGSNNEVWTYKLSGVSIEVHDTLAGNDSDINNADIDGFFADAFEHSVNVNGYKYVLDDEYMLIFALYHIAKHFYHSGCGVRMIMDLPVIIRNSDFSWESVWRKLDTIHLKGFSERILLITEKWFGSCKVQYESEIKFEEIESIEQFIIGHGVYGYDNKNIDADRIRKNSGKNGKERGFAFSVFRWIFPSDDHMRRQVSWYKNKSRFFLPIAYGHRLIHNITKRGGIIKSGGKLINSKKDIDQKNRILSTMKLD